MGLSNKYESLPYSTRQCFTWNNFTQTKTPKHQKYTGNNKNKYLAKHIPKPHPGIKSTMLRPPKKTYFARQLLLSIKNRNKIQPGTTMLKVLLAIHICQWKSFRSKTATVNLFHVKQIYGFTKKTDKTYLPNFHCIENSKATSFRNKTNCLQT